MNDSSTARPSLKIDPASLDQQFERADSHPTRMSPTSTDSMLLAHDHVGTFHSSLGDIPALVGQFEQDLVVDEANDAKSDPEIGGARAPAAGRRIIAFEDATGR
jgi:hypothetical protein